MATGVKAASALALCAVIATGCTSRVKTHGYLPEPETLEVIQVGVDNRDSVHAMLGSPTDQTTFPQEGVDVWYYVSTTMEGWAFMRPSAVDRQVVALYFDQNGNVSDVRHYGFEDGTVIDYNDRETPTRGKELTFLGQIFGNLGRVGAPGQGGPGFPGGGQPGGDTTRRR
ncbi:unnamed protein product [Symbiodinium microadriaticum]|nr:unnamed protein product [Symbiodinium microadriaticum]